MSTAPSSVVVQTTMDQIYSKPALMSTKKKSKASYTQKTEDKKHGRIKHVCKVCDRECGTPSKLKDHIRVHSGERPYMCKICDKLFSRKFHLTRHIRIHTGDTPYQCKVCDKCFSRSGS